MASSTSVTLIKEDRLDTQLLYLEKGVSLIRIPPPAVQWGGYDYTSIENWDMRDVVWTGKLRIVESEMIINDDDLHKQINEKDLVIGKLEFENPDGGLFAVIVYDITGESIGITTSKKAYRALIEHEGMKIAFGLIFADSYIAQGFSIALQTITKHAKESIESRQEYTANISNTADLLDGLRLDNSENIKVDQAEVADSSDDEDFGDFVES